MLSRYDTARRDTPLPGAIALPARAWSPTPAAFAYRAEVEEAVREDRLAAGSGGEAIGDDPSLSVPARIARAARTRDPLSLAAALALALRIPLIAEERGTFDGVARRIRDTFALADATRAATFVAALDGQLAGGDEPPVEWAADGRCDWFVDRAPVSARSTAEQQLGPERGTTPDMEEATIMATGGRANEGRSQGDVLDGRGQLAAIGPQFPTLTPGRGKTPAAPRLTGAETTHTRTSDRKEPGAPMPTATTDGGTVAPPRPPVAADTRGGDTVAGLDELRARRARILGADRERLAAAETIMREHGALREALGAARAELAAIGAELADWRAELAQVFAEDLRDELAGVIADGTAVEAGCATRLATLEERAATLAAHPDLAGLLARQRREEGERRAQKSAADATRRRSAALAAIEGAIAADQFETARSRILASADEFPDDPAFPTLLERVDRRLAAVKRSAALDRVDRARRLLATDPAAALALLQGHTLADVAREVERRHIGVLFAAAEAEARTTGKDDFRYLRLARGARVLMACERAPEYDAGTGRAPVYRVVASYGLGDRFAPGQPVETAMLERSEPRKARA